MSYVYLLLCSDGTFYTGWTNDLSKRLRAHNAGSGARYTRARRPVRLVYWEETASRSAAQRREATLRRLSHQRKAALVAQAEGGRVVQHFCHDAGLQRRGEHRSDDRELYRHNQQDHG